MANSRETIGVWGFAMSDGGRTAMSTTAVRSAAIAAPSTASMIPRDPAAPVAARTISRLVSVELTPRSSAYGPVLEVDST